MLPVESIVWINWIIIQGMLSFNFVIILCVQKIGTQSILYVCYIMVCIQHILEGVLYISYIPTDHKPIRVGNRLILLSPQLPPFKPRWFSNAPRSDDDDDVGGDDDEGGDDDDDGEVFKCTFSK